MEKIIIVGTGYMAKEYIKSLIHLKKEFIVIGNTLQNCELIKKEFENITVIPNGLESYFNNNDMIFSHAIIATPIHLLDNHLEIILETGIKYILIEKPGGLNLDKMKYLSEKFKDRKIFVAYNRRFYPSVIKAKEIINNDGGVLSFTFNITELIHKIDLKKYQLNVLNKWFLCMTTHLIDLSFYLGGNPKEIMCYNTESLNWHNSAIFTGCGITENNIQFSYHGNWLSAGAWKLEIYTKNHLLIFSPLEELKIQKKGDNIINNITFNNNNIKFGILEQVKIFLNDPENENLIEYSQHCQRIEKLYNIMAGYTM